MVTEQNQQESGQKWGTQWTSRADAAVAEERAAKRAESEKVVSRSDRWRGAQFGKMALVWCFIGAVALTTLVGFQWGGWMTTNGAEEMAQTAANAAVVEQLAPICVAQFNLDPDRTAKLAALKESSSYQRATYVSDQNWATMPGQETPVKQVAEACADLLMAIEN